jgi:hypothetical protein
MGNLMGLLTLALLLTYFLVPLPMKMAAMIVGMVTFVYAAYNLVLYRYQKNLPTQSA